MEASHINHASLLIENSGFCIFTDPWVSSLAFGGWTQLPKADIGLVNKAASYPSEKRLILISHGHDDHFDDEYIKQHFNGSDIVIAKFKAPGVLFRAKAVTDSNVIEVDETGINWNGFEIKAYINSQYTGDDAIFTVADGQHFLVHANDNWHNQPKEIISKIARDSKKYKSSQIAWCSQVGIAGSWPIFYDQVPFHKKTDIIKVSLEKMLKGGLENARKIGAGYHYLYANQSSFINKVDYLDYYHRDLWIHEAVSAIKNDHDLHIEQLFPGSQLYSMNCDANSNPSFNLPQEFLQKSGKETIDGTDSKFLESKLKDFENDCNEYLSSKLGGEKSYVAFYDFESNEFLLAKKDGSWRGLLNFVSNSEKWKMVMSGSLNVECMTIGGVCGIYKKNYDDNLREIHIAMSNFGYKYQALQKVNNSN